MTRLSQRIGKRIRELRQAAGLTQQELATMASVSVVHISRLERAQSEQPRRTELESVANALGTTVDELMGLDDEPRPVGDDAEESEDQIDAEIDELTRDPDLLLAFMGRVRDPKRLPLHLKALIRDDLRRLRASQQKRG